MRSLLFDEYGKRKYLTPKERVRFVRAARKLPAAQRTFCMTLVFTGCRISEALSLTKAQIDSEANAVIIESLKKRRRGVFRIVPTPPGHIAELVNGRALGMRGSDRLWPWSRTKAYGLIKSVMAEAHIVGPQATAKGLRHGFAIFALACQVPLTLIQKWMGHSSIETTSIYLQAVGEEEYEIAQRMWAEHWWLKSE